MLKVGLTGGLACGKSFVGQELARLGCLLIQADEIGHQVMAPAGEAYAAVVAEFGRDILAPGGQVDRRLLAARVFDSPERLARLNAIVHPAVFRREDAILAEFAERSPDGIAVLEAAILIETGSHKRFDRIILVTCGAEQQVERALRREGADEAGVGARIARQMPFEEKRKHADFVIDTSDNKESTIAHTRAIYQQLRSIQQ